MKAGKQAKKESMVLREVSTGTEKIMILVLTILALIFKASKYANCAIFKIDVTAAFKVSLLTIL